MKDLKNQPVVIRTPEHRLRVSVSSTLKELAEERQAVHQAILKLQLVPVMFEPGARPHPAQQLYQAYLSRGVVALKQGDYARALDLLTQSVVTLQKFGDKTYPILYIEPIAFIAKEQNLPDHAVRLLSASESRRKAIGLGRTPVDQAEYDERLASVRGQLGETAFATAWAEGSRMTFEQAVAYAVNGSDRV